MSTRKTPTQPPGTTYANIQLPVALHEAMKRIREGRCRAECANIQLHRIYREAVEQYINAKPQQQLLKEFTDGKPVTKSAADRAARAGTVSARL